jgi:hypothetical protein
MTRVRAEKIGTFYRACLDAGDLAKVAIEKTRGEFRNARGKRISRATIYSVCKRLKIKTC